MSTNFGDTFVTEFGELFGDIFHKGFESEKVRKKGLLKVLKKVVGKKKDF